MNSDQIILTLPTINAVVANNIMSQTCSDNTKWPIIINSLLCNQKLCGICLSRADDLIRLDAFYDKETAVLEKRSTLRSLITSAFGFHVLQLLPSGYLCEKCSNKIVQSHFLVQQMKTNHATLMTYFDLIEKNPEVQGEAGTTIKNLSIPAEKQSQIEEQHQKPIYLDSKLICPLCEKVLKYHLYSKHCEKRHSKENVFKCNLCMNILYGLPQLLDHRQSEHNEDVCKTCLAIVNEGLDEHIAMYHANTNLKCDISTKTSPSMEKLEQHQLDHQLANIICQHCLKIYTIDSYKMHKCIYKCEECVNGNCIHEDYLQYYRDQHSTGIELFRCNDCEYTYTKVEEIIAHANEKHLSHYPHVCKNCGERFASVKMLQEHNDSAHKTDEVINNIVRPFKCDLCELRFKFKENVLAHMNTTHPHCQICSRYFMTRKFLNHHIRDYHNITLKKIYRCSKCPEDYQSQTEYHNHFRSHPQDSKFVCRDCGASFLSRIKYGHHLKKHTVLKNAKCKLCHKVFNKYGLRHHYMRVHEKNIQKPSKCVCEECGKVFRSKVTLESHRITHNSIRQCRLCSVEVMSKDYKTHTRTCKSREKEDRTKFYKCPHCDHSTYTKVCITAHINRVHKNVRPYTCDICSKSFFSLLTLKEHIKTHASEKTEHCKLCNERFGCKKSLMLHIRLHTGEKPYQCDLCDKQFISSSRRQDHRVKHFEPSYHCSFCTKKYYTKRCLNTHIKKKHLGNKNKSIPSEIVVYDEHSGNKSRSKPAETVVYDENLGNENSSKPAEIVVYDEHLGNKNRSKPAEIVVYDEHLGNKNRSKPAEIVVYDEHLGNKNRSKPAEIVVYDEHLGNKNRSKPAEIVVYDEHLGNKNRSKPAEIVVYDENLVCISKNFV